MTIGLTENKVSFGAVPLPELQGLVKKAATKTVPVDLCGLYLTASLGKYKRLAKEWAPEEAKGLIQRAKERPLRAATSSDLPLHGVVVEFEKDITKFGPAIKGKKMLIQFLEDAKVTVGQWVEKGTKGKTIFRNAIIEQELPVENGKAMVKVVKPFLTKGSGEKFVATI